MTSSKMEDVQKTDQSVRIGWSVAGSGSVLGRISHLSDEEDQSGLVISDQVNERTVDFYLAPHHQRSAEANN